MTNRRYGVLFTGVTSDLAVRAMQHREGKGGAFTSKYKCTRLVYIEHYPTIEEAIAPREGDQGVAANVEDRGDREAEPVLGRSLPHHHRLTP